MLSIINKVTNEFDIKTFNEAIRLYFKPADGINYFNQQYHKEGSSKG